MPYLVRISDINLYARCPRLIYFDSLGNLPKKMNPMHLLLRAIMLALSSGVDVEFQLRATLSRLEVELPLIYEIDSAAFATACREIEGRIPEIACGLAPLTNRLFPSEVDVDLRSDRLRLSGRLDRLVVDGLAPSIVRTGYAPENGIWKRDRLMLAGYAMLLAEEYGEKVSRGFVEYPRSAVIRDVEIHAVDKSRVLRIRDRILQIKDGRLPDKPEESRCGGCSVRERCETRHSLASKFF